MCELDNEVLCNTNMIFVGTGSTIRHWNLPEVEFLKVFAIFVLFAHIARIQ